MATIRLIFRPSHLPEREGSVGVRVTHLRKSQLINLNLKLRPCEWDSHSDSIRTDSTTNPKRRAYLLAADAKLRQSMTVLQRIIARLDATPKSYTTETIARQFSERRDKIDFIFFAHNLIESLRKAGNHTKADRFKVVVSSLKRFLNDRDLSLEEFDAALMMQYEAWMLDNGLRRNTTSYYMRGLRTIFNLAAEAFDMLVRSPFSHVYTGIDKTRKRALTRSHLRKISQADLSHRPRMAFARDIFLFSFYTRGMSMVDIAYLRKSDLQGGILTYRRRKTRQELYIRWEPQMQAILDRYPNPDSPYLLPLITDPTKDARTQYKNRAHSINRYLKQLGRELALSIPLTSYVARHSWASQAQSSHVAISIISQAMGHDSERTTRIYLASLDTTSVDRANRRVIANL